MIQIIWFNPDEDAYQKGTPTEFDRVSAQSDNRDRFNIYYRFNRTTLRIADKILTVLNIQRKLQLQSL